MHPDHADVLRQFLAKSLSNEHPVTKRVIEAIPPASSTYRPDDIVKSAFDLAWHIVSAEHRFLAAVINGEFDYGGTRPETITTVSDVSAWYARTFAEDIERVNALPKDALVKSIDFRGRFQLPAVVYLQTGLNHSIHHRGQLSMYLRPMGAKVPSIYGESWDATQARLAAQGASA
jgi:uncharacterized damage-inducible protein DinB